MITMKMQRRQLQNDDQIFSAYLFGIKCSIFIFDMESWPSNKIEKRNIFFCFSCVCMHILDKMLHAFEKVRKKKRAHTMESYKFNGRDYIIRCD